MATDEQAQLLVERLSQEMTERRPEVERRLRYYKGESGRLHFASDEFANYFRNRFAGFSDNWCAPVVQSTAERMNVTGIRLGDERRADSELQRVWEVNDCPRGSSEAFVVFMAAAWAYALVHPNPDEPETPLITWEHPTKAIIDRDPVTGKTRAGLITWIDDEYDYATLYLPTEVWKFQRSQSPERYDQHLPNPGGGWRQREVDGETWPIDNPLGVVPMIEMRNQTLLDDDPISDLSGVMSMQDSINLVWAYLLNALDYASLPQRIVTGAEIPKVPVLDANGQDTGARRDLDLDTLVRERILWIPGSETDTSEWSAANLDVFSKVIEHAVEHIAAQTRTPPHYLVARMVNTAAESLTIAEAGLVSKTGERITYVNSDMRKLYSLIALAQGDTAKAQAARSGKILWSNIQYRSMAQLADALAKKREIGYPIRYLLEMDGLEPDEINRVMEMVEEEQSDPMAEQLMREVSGGPGDGSAAPAGPAPTGG